MKKYMSLLMLALICPLATVHAAKAKVIEPKVVKVVKDKKPKIVKPKVVKVAKIVKPKVVKDKKAKVCNLWKKFWNGTKSVRSNGGLAWYKLSDITILDVGSNANGMANDSSDVVPFGGLQAGMQWDAPAFGDGAGLFYAGLGLNYAARKEAIIMNFHNNNETIPTFVVKQDVNDLRLVTRFEWEFLHSQKCSFGLLGGLIISFKTLDKLKVFEKAGDYYIGQRLTPNKVNVLGQIGFAWTREIKEHWALRFHYHYTRGHVKYNTKLIIETPHANAASHHQDALQINETDINLSEKPTMKLHAHEIGWSMMYEF